MTTYLIQVGYNPTRNNYEVQARMTETLAELRREPSRLAKEVLRLEPHWGSDTLAEFANAYLNSREDLPVQLIADCDRPELLMIRQCASGGGEDRRCKEALRRAVCRLILESCHRKGMEINISVV